MTEAEWLACDDPQAMLAFLDGKASDRKLRLFACACCRRVWRFVRDERSREAVAVAERFAEGTATVEELAQAEEKADAAWNNAAYDEGEGTDAETDAADAVAAAACYPEAAINSAANAALCATSALSYEGRAADEVNSQSILLGDIFGNPFRPVAFDPAWRTDTAVALARQMYEAREFSAMPILADALQDAGCDNEEVLSHCRDAGAHVRGCWVVDLVLGKE